MARWETGEEKRTGGFIRVRIISPPGSLANKRRENDDFPAVQKLERDWRAWKNAWKFSKLKNFVANPFKKRVARKKKNCSNTKIKIGTGVKFKFWRYLTEYSNFQWNHLLHKCIVTYFPYVQSKNYFHLIGNSWGKPHKLKKKLVQCFNFLLSILLFIFYYKCFCTIWLETMEVKELFFNTI